MQYICPILDRSTDVDETEFCRDAWSVVRCRETGFVFLANPPEYSELETEFAWEKTAQQEKERRRAEEPIVSKLSMLTTRMKGVVSPGRNKMVALTLSEIRNQSYDGPLRLLDIGCGDGRYMVAMHDQLIATGRDVIPFGVEISKRLSIESAEQVAGFGGKVFSTNAMDAASEIDEDSMHVVAMTSFLEHECRPLALLKSLRSILTVDGMVILKVPNFDCWNRCLRGGKWCGFRYPDHVNYFTPTTLKRLATEAGYEVSRQSVLDRSPFNDNMYAVLKKAA